VPGLHLDVDARVAEGLDEVGVLNEHHGFAHLGDGQDVHGVVDTAAEADKVIDLVAPAGACGSDLVGHAAITGMERDVDVVIRDDEAIRLRYAQPVNVHAALVEECADLQAVLLRSDTHHFMERCLHFKAAADITRGKASRKVVLLENQDVRDSLLLQLKCSGQSGEGAADDDDLVVVLVEIHSNFPLIWIIC